MQYIDINKYIKNYPLNQFIAVCIHMTSCLINW